MLPRPARRQQLQVTANTQRSNSTTKKRTSGPPGLPPINDNSGGGGGGGWDGHKIIRNVAINAAIFGIYCLLDSGGPGGIFNGGGSGGELLLYGVIFGWALWKLWLLVHADVRCAGPCCSLLQLLC